MLKKHWRLMLLLSLEAGAMGVAAAPMTKLSVDDVFAVRDVGEPRLSPDATRVAFTVTQDDIDQDRRETELWIAQVDGRETHRVAIPQGDVSTLHWTPDGTRSEEHT